MSATLAAFDVDRSTDVRIQRADKSRRGRATGHRSSKDSTFKDETIFLQVPRYRVVCVQRGERTREWFATTAE